MAPASDLTGPRPTRRATVTSTGLEGVRRTFTVAIVFVPLLWGLSILMLTVASGVAGEAPATWVGEPLAVLLMVSGQADGPPIRVPALAGCAVVWLALLGGLLDRLARAGRGRPPAFATACGQYWLRFLRVALLAWPAYGLLFTGIVPLSDAGGSGWATRSMILLLGTSLVSMVVDLARIRMVVEDRRSAIGAIAAAGRFVRRRAVPVAGLYGLYAGVWLLAAAGLREAALLVAPGPAAAAAVALALGAVLRVTLLGSGIAFFQAELAHPSDRDPDLH